MKLLEILNKDYELRGWMLRMIRGERRVVLYLKRDKKSYVAHSPFVDKKLSDVEFTEPILV